MIVRNLLMPYEIKQVFKRQDSYHFFVCKAKKPTSGGRGDLWLKNVFLILGCDDTMLKKKKKNIYIFFNRMLWRLLVEECIPNIGQLKKKAPTPARVSANTHFQVSCKLLVQVSISKFGLKCHNFPKERCVFFSSKRPNLGLFLENFWQLFCQLSGNFRATFWQFSGYFLATFCQLSGNFLETFGQLSGHCLANFWHLSCNFLETFWQLSGIFLATS